MLRQVLKLSHTNPNMNKFSAANAKKCGPPPAGCKQRRSTRKKLSPDERRRGKEGEREGKSSRQNFLWIEVAAACWLGGEGKGELRTTPQGCCEKRRRKREDKQPRQQTRPGFFKPKYIPDGLRECRLWTQKIQIHQIFLIFFPLTC